MRYHKGKARKGADAVTPDEALRIAEQAQEIAHMAELDLAILVRDLDAMSGRRSQDSYAGDAQ